MEFIVLHELLLQVSGFPMGILWIDEYDVVHIEEND